MRLTELKKGVTYAFIPRYHEYTRRTVCFDLPDANPVTILDIKKIPVEDGMDACGRPNNKRKTILVYEHYNIPASHMLAKDLDIIKEKHPELVKTGEGVIEAREIVWDWEQEVDKVRTDHEVKLKMNRFYDYIEGFNYRTLSWLVERYRFDKVKPGLQGEAVVSGVDLISCAYGDSGFKLYLYDLFTGHDETPAVLAADEGQNWGRYGHNPCEIGPIIPADDAFQPKVSVSQWLLYDSRKTSEECNFNVRTSYRFSIMDAFLRKFRLITAWKELQLLEGKRRFHWSEYKKEHKEKAVAFKATFYKLYAALTLEERLDVVVEALLLYRNRLVKEFPGKAAPRFDRKRNWKDWRVAEQEKLFNLLPTPQDPLDNE